MPIGFVAAAVDHLTLLVECGLLREIIVPMQLVDILGDDDPLGVLPRPIPDAIACIDRLGAAHSLCTEIGAPGAAARTHRLRQ